MWAAQQQGTPKVTPGSESSLGKVLGVAVLPRHLPESLGIDEACVYIGTLFDRTPGAVHNDSNLLDVQIVRQVTHTIGWDSVAVVVRDLEDRLHRVGVGELGGTDEQEAGDLRQVQSVELDLPGLAAVVC